MIGPFTHEPIYSATNGDLVRVKDVSTEKVVAYACTIEDGRVVADALNNYMHNNTGRNHPDESKKAEEAMRTMQRSKRCHEALMYFKHYGAMSDEMLHLRFVQNEVKITPDRVRHLRKVLLRAGYVEHKANLTAKTENNCACRVYGLTAKHSSEQAND